MGQNQSHVAKHETAQICILSKNQNMSIFCFHQKRNICASLCQLNRFSHISVRFLIYFLAFEE